MGGITSGVGLFSGIDTASLIEQLLAVEARPRTLAQNRLLQLQTQQAAYLDLNSRLSALKTAAAKFRTSLTFDAKSATSSDSDVLSATAGAGAAPGTYSFIVDRLVSARQLLSRGFSDRDTSAAGIGSLTFEDNRARLDRITNLAQLNGGDGIERGKIRITVGGSTTTEVDLSRVATVEDVLNAINDSGAGVTASVEDGRFVIDGNGSTVSVANVGTRDTVETLGIAADTDAGTTTILEGSTVYGLNANTALSALLDGSGIRFKSDSLLGADFTINVGGTNVKINLGDIYETVDGELQVTEAAVSTVGGLVDRINAALDDAGAGAVSVSIDSDNGRLSLNTGGFLITLSDGGKGTLQSLGFDEGVVGTNPLNGDRIFAGIGETLLSSLNGGSGLASLTSLDFTTADGSSFSVDVSGQTTIQGVIREINEQSGGDVVASLNDAGNGIKIVDQTTGGSNLIITSADTTAADLGIDTGAGGVTTGKVDSSSLQLRYISTATRLSEIGGGVGSGTLRFTDSQGITFNVDVGSDSKTLGDVIDEINGQASAKGSSLIARINDTGDGLLIEDTSGGAVPIKVEDTTGSVAKKLRILGESESSDAEDNQIDGSFEVTVEFDATDTLEDVRDKINDAGAGVGVSIINDGGGGNAYRLSFTSNHTGVDGRFILDTHGFDLGLDVLDEGDDAVVFFGSTNPATAVLLQGDSNTLDSVLSGVSIDLKSSSDTPVQLTIARNDATIETDVKAFIKAFNDAIDRVNFHTRYVQETEERGTLLGDGTAISLRSALFSTVLGSNDGFIEGFDSLADVGITIGDGGKLTLDSDRFREALAEDPDAVEALFARRVVDPNSGTQQFDGVTVTDPEAATQFTELGVVGQIEEFANRYIDSISGVLTNKRNSLDSQIKLQQDRIDSITDKLESRRLVLQRQFLAMEQAIAQLQSMNSTLGSIGSVQ
ncbi:MAG: flagellar filament capping protein FliD [Phycisphaerales bacterium]